MKRLLIPSGIAILMALVLLAALGNGGGTGQPSSSSDAPAPAGPTPTPTPAAPAPDPGESSTTSGTYDDRQRRVGEAVPGFGGMFYESGGSVLKVYMLPNTDSNVTDAERVATVRAAIDAEFDNSTAEATAIELIPADYSVTQLLDWYDDLRLAISRAGLVENGGLAGTDLDDRLNRLTIQVTHERFRQSVLDAATTAQVPHEAVNITIGARDELLKNVRDKFRPIAGGIKIQDRPRKLHPGIQRQTGMPRAHAYYLPSPSMV